MWKLSTSCDSLDRSIPVPLVHCSERFRYSADNAPAASSLQDNSSAAEGPSAPRCRRA
ncbi:hypothetical protein MICRO80W_110016 [Micrococcus luteus]|nr:hypothetical protein MICRO80W_110016 [Micrococcus luteus]